MNQPRTIIFVLSIFFCVTFGLSTAAAQADAQQQFGPSYEVTLHVLIGSNDAAARGEIPASLSAVAKQLRSNFTFTNYRLANTFLGRIAANNGNLEYKSVSDIVGQESDPEMRSFLDWSLVGFRSVPPTTGRPTVNMQSFRFGARVPVRTGTMKGEGGATSPIINYESIGLTMSRLGIAENTPTLIGTLSLPKTTGTLFLVITVKPADI